MILQLGPETHPLVRAVASTVLVLHIAGGTLGIVSGTVALAARKGGTAHRIAGDLFGVSMMVMAAIGAAVSPLLPQRANVVPGMLTFYLVGSSWLTMRPRSGLTRAGEILGLLFAVATAGVGIFLGNIAAAAPGGQLDHSAPSDYYLFAGLTAFAAALDVRALVAGGLVGAARLARHLWRMLVALLIGCVSLFLGQAKLFPAGLRGSPLMFLPELLVVGALIFWLVRVWISAAPATARLRQPRPRQRKGPARLFQWRRPDRPLR
jgi:hypothetical protein